MKWPSWRGNTSAWLRSGIGRLPAHGPRSVNAGFRWRGSFLWMLLVLAFAAFWGIYVELRKPGLDTRAMFYGLCVFVLTERIASIVTSGADSERDCKTNNVAIAIKSQGDLHDLGLPADGLQWISNGLEGKNGQAIFVRDLIVRANKNASFSNKPVYDEYLKTVTKFINSGYRYVIVGNKNGLLASDDHVNQARDELFRGSNYVRRLTKGDLQFPIVNCVILEYASGVKEVMFGWDFDNTEACHVFLTRSCDVVNYFERLFAACLEHSKDWEKSEAEIVDAPRLALAE
jgi:hypothetical protein